MIASCYDLLLTCDGGCGGGGIGLKGTKCGRCEGSGREPVALVGEEKAKCQTCECPNDSANHVPGHVFVGSGAGWQPCPNCDGTVVVRRST